MTDEPRQQVRHEADPSRVVVALPTRRRLDVVATAEPPRGVGPDPTPRSGALTVDCADCAHRHTEVCDDCVVSFIVGREPDDAIVVDVDEARAVRLLAGAGLVPGIRHESRVSGL